MIEMKMLKKSSTSSSLWTTFPFTLLVVLIWSSTSITFCNGYVTYMGQFNFYRSEAMEDYFDQVGLVFDAYDEFSNAATSLVAARKEMIEIYKLTGVVPPLPSFVEERDTFLEEWDALMELREECIDFQLLEYMTEPTMTNRYLAELNIELVPHYKEKACLEFLLDERPIRGLIPITKILWRRIFRRRSFYYYYDKRTDQVKKMRIKVYNNNNNNNNNLRSCYAGMGKVEMTVDYPCNISNVMSSMSPEACLEYNQLVTDHKYLMTSGSDFGDWSLPDKESFLRDLRSVEDRWDITFNRFQLMGALDPKFVQERLSYLESFGLDEDQYKTNLHEAHENIKHGIPTTYELPDVNDEEFLKLESNDSLEKKKKRHGRRLIGRIVKSPFRLLAYTGGRPWRGAKDIVGRIRKKSKKNKGEVKDDEKILVADEPFA